MSPDSEVVGIGIPLKTEFIRMESLVILTKKKILSLLVLTSAISGSAIASCPQIEGKYTYTCTVQKDEKSDFAGALDVSGQMLIHQKGCESYKFANMKSQVEEEFLLEDITTTTSSNKAKIGRSDSGVIKFKTIEHTITPNVGLKSLTADITKGTIRKKKDGFVLKGSERSRLLGIFGKRHSKFTCHFSDET